MHHSINFIRSLKLNALWDQLICWILTLVSFFFSLSFNKIAFLWHLKHLIAIVQIIKAFRLPFTNLIAGMSVQKGPNKCVCWGALCLRESGSGVFPYCFRKGLVNLLWLLLHCVQPPPLVSSLSHLVQKTLASAAPQVSQPLQALIWI